MSEYIIINYSNLVSKPCGEVNLIFESGLTHVMIGVTCLCAMNVKFIQFLPFIQGPELVYAEEVKNARKN
jgi:hypothetical protein